MDEISPVTVPLNSTNVLVKWQGGKTPFFYTAPYNSFVPVALKNV
jgi:hypothetical protein